MQLKLWFDIQLLLKKRINSKQGRMVFLAGSCNFVCSTGHCIPPICSQSTSDRIEPMQRLLVRIAKQSGA